MESIKILYFIIPRKNHPQTTQNKNLKFCWKKLPFTGFYFFKSYFCDSVFSKKTYPT